MIGPGLAKVAIAARIDGTIVDLSRPVTGDCSLEVLKADVKDDDSLDVIRHSCAHVMAEAICSIWPICCPANRCRLSTSTTASAS